MELLQAPSYLRYRRYLPWRASRGNLLEPNDQAQTGHKVDSLFTATIDPINEPAHNHQQRPILELLAQAQQERMKPPCPIPAVIVGFQSTACGCGGGVGLGYAQLSSRAYSSMESMRHFFVLMKIASPCLRPVLLQLYAGPAIGCAT